MNRRIFFRNGLALGTLLAGRRIIAGGGVQQPAVAVPVRVDTSVGRGDLAVFNGKILTLETPQPLASAVLVRGGRIVLVGSDDAVRAKAGDAPGFDAGGRLVVPGFIDAHVHLGWTCLYLAYQVDCHVPPHRNLNDIANAIRAKVAATPEGRWVIGRGGDLRGTVEEQRLFTREELDAISDTHPIVIFTNSHVASHNTLAFKRLGLWDKATADNLRWRDGRRRIGSMVARDASGTPTGVATETWDLVYPADDHSVEETAAAIKAHVVPLFVSKGVTSVSTIPSSMVNLRADQALHASGDLPLRVRAYYRVPQQVVLEDLLEVGLLPGFGNDMFRWGGIKIFVDGAGQDADGRPLEDFKWTQEELNEVVSDAQRVGVQAIMHGGLQMALAAIEAAGTRHPQSSDARHRLEHAGGLTSLDDIRRLRKAGGRITITRATRGTGAVRRGTPFRTMIQEGLEPVAISDSTGTEPVFSPLEGIASVIAAPADGGAVTPDQAVTFDEALRMWTLWAARANFEEQDKGSIAVGKLGDFAVLSADPRQLKGSDLFSVKVDETILGGQVVFKR